MAKKLTSDELRSLIEKSINSLNDFLTKKENGSETEKKKASLLAYWIIDYVKYLSRERKFDATKLLKYNRGDILSVDFGYRVGCELGGRHFALVIDNHNSMKSNIITVVPFTSRKEQNKDNFFTCELKHGLYELHCKKLDEITEDCKNELSTLLKELPSVPEEQFETFQKKIKKVNIKATEMKSLQNSIQRLKDGTVVNLGQITTISKMRILNPKQSSDSLNKIKVHPEDLDVISKRLNELYISKDNAKKDKNDKYIEAFRAGIK